MVTDGNAAAGLFGSLTKPVSLKTKCRLSDTIVESVFINSLKVRVHKSNLCVLKVRLPDTTKYACY